MILFIIKILAAIASGSIAIVASAIDSALDLGAGSVFYMTNRMKAASNIYLYPEGKERLEPLGVVVFSSIMAVSMFSVVQEAIVSLRRSWDLAKWPVMHRLRVMVALSHSHSPVFTHLLISILNICTYHVREK